MIDRQKWVDHKFNLGIDIGWTLNIMSRVQDTALRLEHHCRGLTNDELSVRLNKSWSIKEHIGHLIDLEELHTNRLIQFGDFPDILKAADMSNAKTNTANHNEENIDVLITSFTNEREHFIEKYKQLSIANQNHAALHPRIKLSMRPVDLFFFVAEHDDHHITSILHIKGKL